MNHSTADRAAAVRHTTERRWVRTARIIAVLWRAELTKSLTYRADLVLGVIINLLWLAVVAAPVLFAFQYVDGNGESGSMVAIGDGWTLGKLLYMQALWWLLDALVWMLLVPNMGTLSSEVAEGRIDMILLKPVNSLLYISNRRLEILDVLKIPMALALAGYALSRPDTTVSPAGVVTGGVAVLAGLALMWALGVLADLKALTSVRFNASWLAVGGMNLARAPISFYGRALRVFLTAVVPVAFLTTVPAELLFGDRPWWWAILAVVVAGVFIVITVLAWNHQVRRYAGAMS